MVAITKKMTTPNRSTGSDRQSRHTRRSHDSGEPAPTCSPDVVAGSTASTYRQHDAGPNDHAAWRHPGLFRATDTGRHPAYRRPDGPPTTGGQSTEAEASMFIQVIQGRCTDEAL